MYMVCILIGKRSAINIIYFRMAGNFTCQCYSEIYILYICVYQLFYQLDLVRYYKSIKVRLIYNIVPNQVDKSAR